MGILRRLFTARDWWNMVPDQSLIADQPVPGSTLNASARSASGDWAIVYLSRPATVSIRLNKLSSLKSCHARWVDPRTGDRTGPIDLHGQSTPRFSTPAGWDDAVLLVE
ncbi:MAG TPA: putative collagen-binding domain-containing protein, partial [Anaerolineae bacterium]